MRLRGHTFQVHEEAKNPVVLPRLSEALARWRPMQPQVHRSQSQKQQKSLRPRTRKGHSKKSRQCRQKWALRGEWTTGILVNPVKVFSFPSPRHYIIAIFCGLQMCEMEFCTFLFSGRGCLVVFNPLRIIKIRAKEWIVKGGQYVVLHIDNFSFACLCTRVHIFNLLRSNF